MSSNQPKHEDGQALLDEMDKTIPQKVAMCAAHMMLKDGSTVLDAGCANGMTTAYFALKYPEVHFIGVDYDGDYIKTAQQKFGHIPNVEFIQADLRNFSLQGRKVDAALNLSILHEPYSYDGYRAQTVMEIMKSELDNMEVFGLMPNRDFVLPNNPDEMVFAAFPDNDGDETASGYAALSTAEFFLRYAEEAMRFDGGDPDSHIKGFFTEEHTDRLRAQGQDIPEGWRVFSAQHHFAWEFIWRMKYRDRFLNEAEEKYAFWTHNEHRREPEKLGARVLYSAPYENPWIKENWYEPSAKLFDQNMNALPLPPSNFISVVQKLGPQDSTLLREHKPSRAAPSYLTLTSHTNIKTGHIFDLVSRPGGDVVDVLPYGFDGDDLIVFAKDQYPRPIANIKPRMMSPNLDDKRWSGHMIEPLAAANTTSAVQDVVHSILCERAGFDGKAVHLDERGSIQYYPAPNELDERVSAVRVCVDAKSDWHTPLSGGFSGFSNDGVVRAFNAQSLLMAAQVGMLPGARLETGIYALMREQGVTPKPWLGQQIKVTQADLDILPRSVKDLLNQQKQHRVFEPSNERSGWLGINRSEFHEIKYQDGRERVMARKELEFIVPSKDVSTNSVMLGCLVEDPASGEILMGVQKVDSLQSQFASVQNREGHSALLTLPGYRLPSSVDHIQNVPAWIANKTGAPQHSIKQLGEGNFPSLGVMPNRIFTYAITQPSEALKQRCDFVPLRELYENLDDIKDLHLMNAVYRAVHALDLWQDYQTGGAKPETLTPDL